MLKLSLYQAALGILCLFVFGIAAANASLNVRVTDSPYNAIGDGTTDNYAAFAKALADIDAAGGGTLHVPVGRFLIKCTNGTVGYAQPLRVGTSTAIEGDDRENSRISVGSDSANPATDGFREFMRLGTGLSKGDNVTINKLTIYKSAPSYLELFLVSAANFTLEDSTINGNNGTYNSPNDLFAGIWIASYGNVTDLTIDMVKFTQMDLAVWELSSSTGTVDGIRVENSQFIDMNSSGDGLVFNSPSGVMKNVSVDHSLFSGFHTQNEGSGGVVSFANVQYASVTNSVFLNANSDCVHVEDRSANIEVKHNTFVGCGKLFYGPLFVVGSSSGIPGAITHDITFDANVIDARSNTVRPLSPYLLLATSGGATANQPVNINVTTNIFWNGPYSQTWYIQPGSEGTIENNIVYPFAQ
jgi:hypothetical protein